MLALAETLPAGPITCYSWFGNLLQDSSAESSLDKYQWVVEDRNGPYCLALLVRHQNLDLTPCGLITLIHVNCFISL